MGISIRLACFWMNILLINDDKINEGVKMNIEHRMNELERQCKRLQTTVWVGAVLVIFGLTLGMSRSQVGDKEIADSEYTYSKTIQRVELVQSRIFPDQEGWLRGGLINVKVDSNLVNDLRSKPLKVNLTNRNGFSIDK